MKQEFCRLRACNQRATADQFPQAIHLIGSTTRASAYLEGGCARPIVLFGLLLAIVCRKLRYIVEAVRETQISNNRRLSQHRYMPSHKECVCMFPSLSGKLEGASKAKAAHASFYKVCTEGIPVPAAVPPSCGLT